MPWTTNSAYIPIAQSADTSNTVKTKFGLANSGNPYTTFDMNKILEESINGKNPLDSNQLNALGLKAWYDNQNQQFLGMNKGTLQGVQGLADIGTSLAGLYYDYQNNKRADDAFRLQKQEYNRGVQKDKDFSKGIAASGLGSYSAGV